MQVDESEQAVHDADKKTRLDDSVQIAGDTIGPSSTATAAPTAAAAAALAAFTGVLDQASLEPPKQPTKEEMDKILLEVRKRALLAEYDV